MSNRLLPITVLVLVLTITAAGADHKPAVRVQKIADLPTIYIGEQPSLSAAIACSVSQYDEIVGYIAWVTGEEWYKSYMDPAVSCSDPYPFEVTFKKKCNELFWFTGHLTCPPL